jgi:MATE family multidrug resistance protein
MVVLWNAGYIISSMHNIDPLLAEKAVGYLRALLWGAPGYLFFQVARNQCEGLAKTKPGMVMGFIGLLVNIPVNYIFIYGHFGMPELGGVGCGVATASVYWVMFASMLVGAPGAFDARYPLRRALQRPGFRRPVTAGAAGAAHCSGAVL